MGFTKKQREEVKNKSGGLCWYCGSRLEKGWHVDHFEPIRRFNSIEIKEDRIRHFVDCENPELDTIDNWVPACKRCNLFKSVYSIEQFRSQLHSQVEKARSYSVNFRNAERFGLIEVIDKPIVFWFEEKL